MPSILHDVFPATVAFAQADFHLAVEDLRSQPPSPGAAPVSVARVVVSNDRIVIARDAGSGPVVVFSEAIDPSQLVKSRESSRDSYITTLTGKKIAYRKDGSCGCGSRLRSWRPFGNMSSVKDPS